MTWEKFVKMWNKYEDTVKVSFNVKLAGPHGAF